MLAAEGRVAQLHVLLLQATDETAQPVALLLKHVLLLERELHTVEKLVCWVTLEIGLRVFQLTLLLAVYLLLEDLRVELTILLLQVLNDLH